ncbi:MAG: hypothetical protein E4H40_07190, partial [Candidatus Brocadiia bacterium]
MKKVIDGSVLILLVLSIIFCCSCETTKQKTAATSAANAQSGDIPVEQSKKVQADVSKDKTPPATAMETDVRPVQENVLPQANQQIPANVNIKSASDIVAEIGDYKITREQLEKRLIYKYVSFSNEESNDIRPIDRDTVLRELLAENATIIKGREANELNHPYIKYQIEKYSNETLAELLVQKYLQENLVVSDQEIENKMKSDPNFTRESANHIIMSQKSRELPEQYWQHLLEKAKPQKIKENYATAVKANYTMIAEGMEKDKRSWLQEKQVADLPQTIKDTPLVTFDKGTVTIQDFFMTLCNFSPPKRPANLNSYKAFDEMLDTAVRLPIYAAEAKKLGLDKDSDYLSKVKEREDLLILVKNRVTMPRTGKPTEEELKAYFEKNRSKFATPRTIKADVIWCNDLQTARSTRTELDKGADFKDVGKKYSFTLKSKSSTITPGSENIFFNELWAGEPNQVVGPIKGLYNQ